MHKDKSKKKKTLVQSDISIYSLYQKYLEINIQRKDNCINMYQFDSNRYTVLIPQLIYKAKIF